jgi:eukaryotic-like serine/threonine-protein kinase
MTLTAELVLPSDVLIIPVIDLPEEQRQQLGSDGDFALTRPRGRSTSSLIGAAVADLLGEFRAPTTVIDAILRYSRRNVVDPEATLDDAYPVLKSCVDEGYLVEPGSEGAEAITPDLAPGDIFADCAIERCIHILDDSEIHRVTRADGSPAVLKLARLGRSNRIRATFERERHILTVLDGRGAPKLFASGVTDDRNWMLIEWCEGQSANAAAARIRRHVSDDAGRKALLALSCNIADAYAVLHGSGVVHGDVHPGNIIVSEDDSVRIIDFGLGRLADANDGPAGPNGPRGGIVAYFEPEYATALIAHKSPPRATYASDLHAASALIYHLVTGVAAFDLGLEMAESLRKITNDVPLPFTRHGVQPWPDLEVVLRSALAKLPEERPSSMIEFAAALRTVQPATADPGTAVRSNGAGRAGADARSTAETMVDEVIAAASPEGSLYVRGHQAPLASITYGSSGLAAGLLRIAKVRDDADLLLVADDWACRALRQSMEPEAFTSEALGITDDLIGPVSPYHRESGTHLVRALVHHASGDVNARQEAVNQFVAASNQRCANIDLTLGTSGTLLAASLLLEEIGNAQYSDLAAVRRLGASVFEEMWAKLDSYGPVADSTELTTLGIAHGWAGMLLATLRWCGVSGSQLPHNIVDRLDQLGALAEPAGQALRWRWSNSRDRTSAATVTMPGWCNGSAGHVHLWTAAHARFGEPRYLELAERAGLDASAQSGTTHLCCGSAGQAYALLELYRHTGEQRWLTAAETLATRSARDVVEHHDRGLIEGSLYKGEIGIAALLVDLERPELASMPIFGADA